MRVYDDFVLCGRGEEHVKRGSGDQVHRLVNDGQWRCGELGGLGAVEGDQRHLVWHPQIQLGAGAQHTDRLDVGADEKGAGAIRAGQQL